MKEMNLKEIVKARAAYRTEYDRLRNFNSIYCERYPDDVARTREHAEELRKAFDETAVKVNDAIKEVEGKASARLASAADLADALLEIEKKLSITKKAMEGIATYIDVNAQDFPSAYKYRPMSTQFFCEFRNGYWRLKNIVRDDCEKAGQKFRLSLTDAAKDAIIHRYNYW